MKYKRLIVCGDSYSEGMSDEIINGQYRGWADRIADVMARADSDFSRWQYLARLYQAAGQERAG